MADNEGTFMWSFFFTTKMGIGQSKNLHAISEFDKVIFSYDYQSEFDKVIFSYDYQSYQVNSRSVDRFLLLSVCLCSLIV